MPTPTYEYSINGDAGGFFGFAEAGDAVGFNQGTFAS